MGGMCAQSLNEIDKELIIKDISFKDQSSVNDKYFINERKNYLQYLTLSEILQFIYNINPEADSVHQGKKSYYAEVAVYKFPLLLKNKLMYHPLVIHHINNDDKTFKLFDTFCSKMFENIYKNYKSLYKSLYDEKLRQNTEKLPKLAILPMAFQWAGEGTPNKLKLHILFNLFCDDGELKADSKDFYIFVYFMFVMPTNISLLTLNEMAEEDEEVRKVLSEDDFLTMYNAYETKDSRHATEAYIKDLFEDSATLNYQDFEKRITEKNLSFIFSFSATRAHLDFRNSKEN